MSQLKYRVNLAWSEADQAYLVELPEFATEIQRYFTDGDTYEEALKNAQEVMELLVESHEAEGRPPCHSLKRYRQREEKMQRFETISGG